MSSTGLRKKFIRKLDCGNPRYGADKAPSQVGLLVGQKSRPEGFIDPPAHKLEELERDPMEL